MIEGSKKQKRIPSIRKTRKHRAHTSVEGGIHRIPELKKAFDQLNQEVAEILRSGEKGPTRIKHFQQVWRKLFGRPVDKAAAEAYLEAKVRSRRRNDGTRKQKGGMAAPPLAGAPLDYQTRPGIDGTHGSFLPYVGPTQIAQFDAVTTQDSIFTQCGKIDTTPSVGVSMGSNLANMEGGGVLKDLTTYWDGRTAAPPPDPSQKAFQYK